MNLFAKITQFEVFQRVSEVVVVCIDPHVRPNNKSKSRLSPWQTILTFSGL